MFGPLGITNHLGLGLTPVYSPEVRHQQQRLTQTLLLRPGLHSARLREPASTTRRDAALDARRHSQSLYPAQCGAGRTRHTLVLGVRAVMGRPGSEGCGARVFLARRRRWRRKEGRRGGATKPPTPRGGGGRASPRT
jgi:hypothetical protein